MIFARKSEACRSACAANRSLADFTLLMLALALDTTRDDPSIVREGRRTFVRLGYGRAIDVVNVNDWLVAEPRTISTLTTTSVPAVT